MTTVRGTIIGLVKAKGPVDFDDCKSEVVYHGADDLAPNAADRDVQVADTITELVRDRILRLYDTGEAFDLAPDSPVATTAPVIAVLLRNAFSNGDYREMIDAAFPPSKGGFMRQARELGTAARVFDATNKGTGADVELGGAIDQYGESLFDYVREHSAWPLESELQEMAWQAISDHAEEDIEP